MADTLPIAEERGESYGRAGEVRHRRLRPMDVLWKRGHITARQCAGGDRLYWDWVIGDQGALPDPDELPPEIRPQPGSRDYPIVRLDALRRYREAMQALGKRLSVVAVFCCGDLPVGELASKTGQDRKALTGVIRVGLDILADHYAIPEREAS